MLDFIFSPGPGIIVLVVVILLVGLIYAKAVYKNAGPDEALVITGRRARKTLVDGLPSEESGIKVVHGSGVFLAPFFQKAARLSLKSRAIEISALAQDQNGVTLTVEAVAIVKVGEQTADIRAAAQRFLGQEKNIDIFAQEVLSGSLRASIGATEVSTIIKKRDELGLAVLNVARAALANQGLEVDSFEIKGIHDTNGYINDLGRPEQARVKLLAEVAETNAIREAREANVIAEQAIAEAENTLALKRAALQLDTDKAAAEAAAARPIAEAKAQQRVVEEQELTARSRAALRKTELTSEVNAVADADAYRIEVNARAAALSKTIAATAEKDARIAAADAVRSEAQATRDSRITIAEAVLTEANAQRDARIAGAAAVAAEGEAEASAILAKGNAEAAATKASAEALAEQSEALIQLRVIEALPLIAHELASPMGNIKDLTVISTDGASALTKTVASGFGEVGAVLKSTTGMDLGDLLKSVAGGAAGAGVLSRATPTTTA